MFHNQRDDRRRDLKYASPAFCCSGDGGDLALIFEFVSIPASNHPQLQNFTLVNSESAASQLVGMGCSSLLQ